MKGIGSVAAMRGRIGEQRDHFDELDDGPRPTVREKDRHRRCMGRADVQEMDTEAVNLREELREGVETLLALAPVVGVRPIVTELSEVGEGNTLRPVVHGFGFGPTGGTVPLIYVEEAALCIDCIAFGLTQASFVGAT